MNFKRHRTKNRRAGCLECKPWKAVGVGDRHVGRPSEQRKAEGARQELAALRGTTDRAELGHRRPARRALVVRDARAAEDARRRTREARVASFPPGAFRCGFLFGDD